MGQDDGRDEERPAHRVTVAPFRLAPLPGDQRATTAPFRPFDVRRPTLPVTSA